MKAIVLSVLFEVASRIALAQGTGDPMAHLRACSVMEQAERRECLDKLSRSIEPSDRSLPGREGWIVSETTSPVDYTPIVTATAFSRGDPAASLTQLSIRCRGGRTELVVAGPVVSGATDYTLSYRINDAQPVHPGAGPPSSGAGVAFRGDVVGLLLSLPEEGGITVVLSPRTGTDQQGHFPLSGLKAARDKVATACKWPNAVARPRNQ